MVPAQALEQAHQGEVRGVTREQDVHAEPRSQRRGGERPTMRAHRGRRELRVSGRQLQEARDKVRRDIHGDDLGPVRDREQGAARQV